MSRNEAARELIDYVAADWRFAGGDMDALGQAMLSRACAILQLTGGAERLAHILRTCADGAPEIEARQRDREAA